MAGKSVLDLLKRFGLSFRRNWGLKLVSLLFAVILWNYAITAGNPTRSASFNNINIVFDQSSLTQLNNAGYTIVGALPEKAVDVTIELKRSQYNDLSKDSIRATVSLSGITSGGRKELKINIYTPIGSVKSQSVNTLPVVIEELADRTVPVDWKPEGELPVGYWMGVPDITATVLKVSGASSMVRQVERARIVVDLTNLTEKLSTSREFELLDKDGNVISSAGLKLDPPNCIVNLDVLPTKTVRIDASKSISGSVAKGYEVTGIEVLPSEVVIAGPKAVLDTITSVAPESIDISGITADKSKAYKLVLPKGVIAVGESTVTVLVKVEEKMTEVSLSGLKVHVLNLGSGLKVDNKQLLADVLITCPELLAPMIKASMIRLTVNASGLEARTYTLAIQADYDPVETGITGISINPETILVTISAV